MNATYYKSAPGSLSELSTEYVMLEDGLKKGSVVRVHDGNGEIAVMQISPIKLERINEYFILEAMVQLEVVYKGSGWSVPRLYLLSTSTQQEYLRTLGCL